MSTDFLAPTNAAIINASIQLIRNLSVTLGNGAGDRAWTKALHEEFRLKGKAFGYEVCPDVEECNAGWLYNLVWFRNDNDRMVEVPLILESEWSRDWRQVRHDFEKLLQAKAVIKVMVFEEDEKTLNINDLWRKFCDSIRAFGQKSPDEIYLLAGFCHAAQGFLFRIIRDASNPQPEEIDGLLDISPASVLP